MADANEVFKVISLDDGSSAVVKVDHEKPRLMEIVAIFYDAARAHAYAGLSGGRREAAAPAAEPVAAEPIVAEPAATSESANEKDEAEPIETEPGLTVRQSAVLGALRAKMDDENSVEIKAAILAEAAQIPLGSLHSVLVSLEKKQLIATTRAGTPRSSAVYQVL
jgi:hypothetical protein